jgi:hypothetical protein
MTRSLKSALIALAALSFALTACGKGVEGKYSLDKASMKKEMEEKIAKMPADQQEMGKLGLAMVDAMDMTIDLKKGGEADFTVKMAEPGKEAEAKSESKKGKWTQQEKQISLQVEGETKKLECTAEGNKLTCKDNESTLVFIRS